MIKVIICVKGVDYMKLVAIVGTNSTRSTNRKLLKFMAKHFADVADIELLEIKDSQHSFRCSFTTASVLAVWGNISTL